MGVEDKSQQVKSRWRLSLDGWAVLVALLAALLVRIGVFKHIPW